MSNKTPTQCVLSHCISTIPHLQMTPAHFLLHSKWPHLFLQSYATVNTASESVFFSPRQQVLIIGECQGCLLGPPHFSQSQTHFLLLCNIVPLLSKHTHKHTSYAASLKCIPLFLKWGDECCYSSNGHWCIS